MSDTNIALELARASQTWPEPDESSEDYADRLMHAVDNISEDEFYGMPEDAQKWQEDALVAFGNKIPLPDLDGFAELGDERPEARVAKPNGSDHEGDPKKARRAAKERKSKGKKEPGERKTRQLSGTGKVSAIVEVMIKNPNASVDDIRKALSERGLEASQSSVPTFRSAFRNCFSILNKNKKLTGMDVNY